MLTRLAVRNFKSLRDVNVELPRLAVFFGPNAAGKSNLLEAILTLSFIGTRTLDEALGGPLPVRGLSFEAFSIVSGGMPDLLQQKESSFLLEADLKTGEEQYRYRVEPEIDFRSGDIRIADEYLARLGDDGRPSRTPAIERVGSTLRIQRADGGGIVRRETADLAHSLLSDRSLGGEGYACFDQVRGELASWRAYYFEPRLTMREEKAPARIHDIGAHGEDIAPFLYKLRADRPKHFEAVSRTLRAIVPTVENVTVDLDERRGTVDLGIRQAGVDHSSRVLSEGTLRVLALCAVAINPWGGSLVALEEPENGVHPRRLDLVAKVLRSLSEQKNRQVVVATHSPLLVDEILAAGRMDPDVGLFSVRRHEKAGTLVKSLGDIGPLWDRFRANRALEAPADDGAFENLLLRGFIDG